MNARAGNPKGLRRGFAGYDFLVRHVRLVADARNATRAVKENREKIIRC
ncbi:MAG TPA: hypothetical protein VGW33_10315 [Terriglobia bacterium]|nr:hypothetical protein [Terriglobia bacterium]